MYQVEKVKACLLPLLGFRQPENEVQIAASLTTSKTGLYYNDIHPLITVENILHIIPKENTLDNFLKNLVGAAGIKLIESIFEQKKLERSTKTILEDTYLYSYGGNIIDLEIKENRFVGLEINVLSAKDVSTIINQVGTQFTGANPDFKLYLYKQGQAEPFKTWQLDLPVSGGFVWTNVEPDGQILDTGIYYLGYYETDVTGQAVRKVVDLHKPPCSTCNAYDINSYNKWSQYIEVRAFFVPAQYIPEDVNNFSTLGMRQYNTASNYGLNLQVSSSCDLSNFLCRHSKLLTNALGLQVAVDILSKMAFGQRENGLSQQVKAEAFMELNNKDNNQTGLITRLDKAVKALSFDLSDFNSVCLPCVKEQPEDSIEWGVM